MFETGWQDVVFGIGQVIFVIALIPSIISPSKPAFLTSFTTASILSLFAFSYFTLELWFGMVGSAMAALSWWVLAYQKWKQDKVAK